MTAAATTGPKSEPRPTSSTPATNFAPVAHASFSNFVVHLSFLRRRSLAAALEMGLPSFVVAVLFDLGTVVRREGCRPLKGTLLCRRAYPVDVLGYCMPPASLAVWRREVRSDGQNRWTMARTGRALHLDFVSDL